MVHLSIPLLLTGCACLARATSFTEPEDRFEDLLVSYQRAVADDHNLVEQRIAHEKSGFALRSLLLRTEAACIASHADDVSAPSCSAISAVKQFMDDTTRGVTRDEDDIMFEEIQNDVFSAAIVSLVRRVLSYKRNSQQLTDEVLAAGFERRAQLARSLRLLLSDMCANNYLMYSGRDEFGLVARAERVLGGVPQKAVLSTPPFMAAADELDSMDFESLRAKLYALLCEVQSHMEALDKTTNGNSFDRELAVLERAVNEFARAADQRGLRKQLMQQRANERSCVDILRDHNYLSESRQAFLEDLLVELKSVKMSSQARGAMALAHVVNNAVTRRVREKQARKETLASDRDSLRDTLVLWKIALEKRETDSSPMAAAVQDLIEIVDICLAGVREDFRDGFLPLALFAKLNTLRI